MLKLLALLLLLGSLLLLLLACAREPFTGASQSEQTASDTAAQATTEQATSVSEEQTGEWEAYWGNEARDGYTKRY